MPLSSGFAISALQTGAQALLQGRPVISWPNTLFEYSRKAALEYAENYKHPLLQTDANPVQLTALTANYLVSFFMSTTDATNVPQINKIDSFFIFNTGYQTLTLATQQNTGFELKFTTMDTLTVLINIPGLPTKWTRHNNQIWFGSVPDQPYSVQMRYSKEHPFPTGTNSDLILFDNSWQDIMEYAVAMRVARDLNLQSKANELHRALYGDQAFQTSGGIEGQPGLIFQRTSQENRDQSTTTKSLRLKMGMQI